MTRDEVIKLAIDAGLIPDWETMTNKNVGNLERFAALVAAAEREAFAAQTVQLVRDAVAEAKAAEREACAKLCEAEEQRILSKQSGRDFDQVDANLRMIACILPDIADAIRARGEQ